MDEDKLMKMSYEIQQLMTYYNDLKEHREMIDKELEKIKMNILLEMKNKMQVVNYKGEVVVKRLSTDGQLRIKGEM